MMMEKKGDKVVLLDAQTGKEIASSEIENKTWERVFVKTENDTLELNDWIEKKGAIRLTLDVKLLKINKIIQNNNSIEIECYGL